MAGPAVGARPPVEGGAAAGPRGGGGSGDSSARLADLCDPAYLNARAVAPDTTASRLRERTQPVARAAWDRGHHGLRWWSTFWGDWHTVVLFTARVARVVRYGDPVALAVDHPAVLDAAGLLGMATG